MRNQMRAKLRRYVAAMSPNVDMGRSKVVGVMSLELISTLVVSSQISKRVNIAQPRFERYDRDAGRLGLSSVTSGTIYYHSR
jgi:hypothetical protein